MNFTHDKSEKCVKRKNLSVVRNELMEIFSGDQKNEETFYSGRIFLLNFKYYGKLLCVSDIVSKLFDKCDET